MTLRWKLIAILVVLVAFSAVGVYPIVAARYGVHSPALLMEKQLKLGLDLKGGVHLVLRVQTDDALRLQTEQEMERLRANLMTKGIMVGNITMPDLTHFVVEGVPPAQDAAFRAAATEVGGTDRKSTRLNSSHITISYAVFCLKKKRTRYETRMPLII